MKRRWAALAVASFLAVLVWSATGLRLDTVAARFAALSWPHCALALLLYALSYVGRALRLRLLLPGASTLVHLASISARHNLFNLVLPFRSGEATLPWMLKAETGTDLAEGTASLLLSRVLDLFSVAAWCLLGLALGASSTPAGTAPRVLAVLAGMAVVLISLGPVARRIPRPGTDAGRVRAFAGRTAAHVAALPPGRLLGVALATLATWLLTYAACWVLVLAMAGPDAEGLALARVDFAQSLVGTTGLHLTGVLPVNTPASVGIWEAGWTTGYVLAGLEKTAAGTSAIVTHALIFAYVTLLGGIGFLLRRRAPPPATWSG